MSVREYIKENILLFDGAMGTMLQENGLPVGMQPEYFNLSHPEVVQKIHEEYVVAGCDVITANTFQANVTKLKEEEVVPIIQQAIALAKNAGPRYVAMDMGPIGQLMAPMGTLTFDRAYELFKEQVIAAETAGADILLFETMSDLLETKAAILAAKENTQLPIFVTMTFQEDGRTFVGTDPLTAVLTLQELGIDALGVNCSLGPKELLPTVKTILEYAKIPVMVQANAGLPSMADGQTVYPIQAAEYADIVSEMLQAGARIIGGCCGTTPAFIRALKTKIQTQKLIVPTPKIVTAITSASKSVILDGRFSVIGERLNPTGKKRLKEALRTKDMSYILKEALDQANAGADILDVNVGLPELDEAEMMIDVVREVQGIVTLPLQIDSSSVPAIEAGCRYYNGRPLINSVNGKAVTMEAIFPIAKKYGAAVLGLCLDEEGIPDTAEKRLAVADKIVATAAKYGIPKESVLIDPLVLTASAQQEQVGVTLQTLSGLRERGLHTVAGVSNVSFGLPNREVLNSNFLAAAFGAGLDTPIINPLSQLIMNTVRALRVINGQDRDSADYIANSQVTTITSAANVKLDSAKTGGDSLRELILEGRKEDTPQKTRELLKTKTPLEVVNQEFIPALDEVGAKFEAGTLFLPQLMQSAEAVKQAQEVLKNYLAKEDQPTNSKQRILLTTVEGDIHDIGKNIVKMILENYGFDIVDLGKDVPIEKVVAAIKAENIKLVGLSALMTTTVQNMKKTISAVRAADLDVTFMVGGAVLNEEYREFVGADYYAKDAMDSVMIAKRFFGESV